MATQQTRYSERVPGLMAENSISVYPNLAKVLGLNEAIILQQIFFYMNVNQRKKSLRHFHDGKWWVYNSYKQWRDEHFVWLTPRGVQNFILKLEEKGILLSIQGVENPYDRRKWYTIDLEALGKALNASTLDGAQIACSTFTDCTMDMHGLHDEYTESTTETSYRENELQKQPTTTHAPDTDETETDPQTQTDVVVVPLPHREPEAESGEHCLNSEGQDVTAIKAHRHAEQQNRNDENPSKIPQKVSAPALVAKLVETQGFPAGLAETLVRQHGAGRIRAIARFIESKGKDIHTPPGYMRYELKFNEQALGIDDDEAWDTVCNADQKTIYDHETRLSDVIGVPDYDAERIAELEAREHIPPLSVPVGLDVKPSDSMTVAEIWQTANHQLSLLFDRPSFDMWLKDAHVLGYQDAVLRIGVSSARAQEMLQYRFYRNVQRVVEGLGNTPITLQFEVSPPPLPHQQPLSVSERDELHRLRAEYNSTNTLEFA